MDTTKQNQEDVILKVEDLTKVFPESTPIHHMSFEVRRGESIVVIGPSGTGKSTLLRMLNMLEKPTEGHIYIEGEDITAPDCHLNQVRQKVGMVFQSYTLFNHMTVIENLMDAQVRLLRRSRQEAYERGVKELDSVHMSEHMMKYPDELSGGQRQRVAIARALAMDPLMILFDEPTSALDPSMVGEVEAVLRDLSERGVSMMIVTHEMRVARDVPDRVFFLTDGVVYEEGSPQQIFEQPEKEETRIFVKRLRMKQWEITTRQFDLLSIMTDIEEFGRKNSVNQRTIRNTQSVLEEVTLQLLMPEIEGQPDMLAQVEYSAENESMKLAICYNGRSIDVENSANDLSLQLVRDYTQGIIQTQITHVDGMQYANRIDLDIKTGGGRV